MTAPRNVDVKERSMYSLALAWQAPECGSVGEYQIELRGRENQIFDIHRQTVAQPSASITSLLSGTEYAVRIRAVDRSRALGPWNEELVSVSTKGDIPEASADISVEYKSDKEARIRWKHLDDERLHYYTVSLFKIVSIVVYADKIKKNFNVNLNLRVVDILGRSVNTVFFKNFNFKKNSKKDQTCVYFINLI